MQEQEVVPQRTWSEQRAFDDAYDRNKRKLWVAYSLAVLPLALFGVGLAFRWITMFFGLLGIHRFYLGRSKTAILMLLLWQGGFLLITGASIYGVDPLIKEIVSDLVAFPMMLAGLIWFIVDLFRMPRMVRRFNEKLAAELAEGYKSEAGV